MENFILVMWKRGLLGFVMVEKKRGKIGKCKGARKCVFHWGQYGHMDSNLNDWCVRGEGGGHKGDRQSAVTQFCDRSKTLVQNLTFPTC